MYYLIKCINIFCLIAEFTCKYMFEAIGMICMYFHEFVIFYVKCSAF